MKYNDFECHTPEMIQAAQTIINRNGYCIYTICQNCPVCKINRKDKKNICGLSGIICQEKDVELCSKEYFRYIVQYMRQYLNLIQKRKLELLKK